MADNEDISAWLQDNANKVGTDLLRQIDDGVGFIVVFVHRDSKSVKFTSNIVKGPLMYILKRLIKAVDGTPESRILTINAQDKKLITKLN